MKSSKVNVKVQSKMTNIGHLSLVTLMALSLSAGQSVFGMSQDTLKMYKAGTPDLFKSGMTDATTSSSFSTKAKQFMTDKNFSGFVNEWKDEPKLMAQAWAEVLLASLEDGKVEFDKAVVKDLKEKFFAESMHAAYGQNKDGADRWKAYSELFDLIAAQKKADIESGKFLEVFRTQSLMDTFKIAFDPTKPKTKGKGKPKTGEKSGETDGSAVDCSALVEKLREDVMNGVKAVTGPIENAMQALANQLADHSTQQAPENFDRQRRADAGDQALAATLARLAPREDDREEDRGDGGQQPQTQAQQPPQPEETPSTLDQEDPKPELPQQAQEQVESGPSQLVQVDPDVRAKELPSVGATAEAIADAATRVKRVKNDSTDLLASLNSQQSMLGAYATNPQVLAMQVPQNITMIATQIGEIEEQQAKIEAQQKNWAKKLKSAKTELAALNENDGSAIEDTGTEGRMKTMITQLKARAGQTQNKTEKAKLDSEVQQQEQLLASLKERKGEVSKGLKPRVKALMEEVEQAEAALASLTGEAEGLSKTKKSLQEAITREQGKLLAASQPMQAGGGRGALIQQASSGRPRTNLPTSLPGALSTGGSSSGAGRLPLSR